MNRREIHQTCLSGLKDRHKKNFYKKTLWGNFKQFIGHSIKNQKIAKNLQFLGVEGDNFRCLVLSDHQPEHF